MKIENIYQKMKSFIDSKTFNDEFYAILNEFKEIVYSEPYEEPIFTKIPLFPNLEMLTLLYTNIKFLPNGMTKLTSLTVNDLEELPEDLINLEHLCCSLMKKLPKNCPNIKKLNIINSDIEEIPETYINLEFLSLCGSNVKKLPSTLTKLKTIIPNKYIDLNTIPTNILIGNCSCLDENLSLATLNKTISNFHSRRYIKHRFEK